MANNIRDIPPRPAQRRPNEPETLGEAFANLIRTGAGVVAKVVQLAFLAGLTGLFVLAGWSWGVAPVFDTHGISWFQASALVLFVITLFSGAITAAFKNYDAVKGR